MAHNSCAGTVYHRPRVLISPLLPVVMWCSRMGVDAMGQQQQESEILTIEVKAGWKKGTRITFQEKGEWRLQAASTRAGCVCSLWPGRSPVYLSRGSTAAPHIDSCCAALDSHLRHRTCSHPHDCLALALALQATSTPARCQPT
jgi:hypothetical protein